MAEAAHASDRTVETITLQWLALPSRRVLGQPRSRRLVDFFGGVKAVFQASLTELEAAGLQAVSAQSLGTGKLSGVGAKRTGAHRGCGSERHFAGRLRRIPPS